MWAISRVLNMIYDELERTPFILCFRGSLCTRSYMFEEWLEALYTEAVEQSVRSLSEASYDADLRARIMSGEGDDEVFGITAYLFESEDALDDFVQKSCSDEDDDDDGIIEKASLGLIQDLDEFCEYTTFTVYESVCMEREVKSLLK